MDKNNIYRDSRYILNCDFPHFGIGGKIFPIEGKVNFKIQLLKKMGIEDTFISKPNYVDLVNLVRSIQRAEGNSDCYRRGVEYCNRMNCAWRDHCLKESEGPSRIGSESHEHKKATNLNPNQEQDGLH